jgi:DNA-binding transcriptional ArsR family regulator
MQATDRPGPDIARVAALIGDRARADLLGALLAGQALTASELANVAGVTKQTISAHLAKLRAAGLIAVESQGRHRYVRLADHSIAQMLENLMQLAQRGDRTTVTVGPRDPALRRARVCYDHLAGDIGVSVYDGMCRRNFLRNSGGSLQVTARGRTFLCDLGIDVADLAQQRRTLCRPCLDWSVRRHHLAGSLGAALLDQCFAQGWARRAKNSRIVTFTVHGERALRDRFA